MAALTTLLAEIGAGHTPWKIACRVVSTANLTLSTLQTVDAVALAEGDRVLVAGQTDPKQNGIYLASANTWTRAPDMARSSYAMLGTTVRVMEGATNGGSTWSLTTPVSGTIRIGVTEIDFTEDAGGSGPPLADAAPPAIAAAGAVGVSTDAAREDHTHAHGTQAGGTLHADVIAAGASGFMSGADKTKLDNAVSTATASRLAIRDGSANCAFATVTAAGVVSTGQMEISATGDLILDSSGANPIDIGGSTALGVNIGRAGQGIGLTADTCSTDYNALVCDVDTTITLRDGGTDRAVITTAAAFSVVLDDGLSSFDLSWQADTVGAGGDTTITTQAGLAGSANGKLRLKNPSGNTVLGGGVIVDVGSAVSNVSDQLGLEANGTRLLSVYQNAGGSTLVKVGPNDSSYLTLGGSSGSAANSLTIVPNGSVSLTATAGYMLLSSSPAMYVQPTAGVQLWNGSAAKTFMWLISTTTITTATTTTLLSWTTTSNRVYQVEAFVAASNDTDNEGAAYHLRAAFRNVGGTVTQIGTTTVTVVGEDAGQAGLDATIDFSGTALRVRFVSDAADTLQVETVFSVVNVVVLT